MECGMWYVSVTGRTRLDDREVDLDFRVERDDRGLWHAGLMTEKAATTTSTARLPGSAGRWPGMEGLRACLVCAGAVGELLRRLGERW